MPDRPVPLQLPKGVVPWASDESEYDLEDDSDMVAAIRETRQGVGGLEEKAEELPGKKVYLLAGENAPAGADVQTGPRGGRFFVPDGSDAHRDWVSSRRKAARARARLEKPRAARSLTAGQLMELEARPISVSGGESTVRQLGKAMGSDDGRYAPFVREMRDRGRRAITEYLRGDKKVLAEFSDGQYGSVILDDFENRELVFKDGWEPAISGKWMDFEEEHWGLSKRDYRSMPEEARAELECREQVSKRVPSQFYGVWLETYHPEEYDRRWFSQGGSMTFSGQRREWDAILKLVAERIKREGPSVQSQLEDAMDMATSVSSRFGL